MIVVRYKDEIAYEVMRAIEHALKGYEAEIVETDEEVNELEIMASIAFNLRKSRQYVGRLERNTSNLHVQLRDLTDTLIPLSMLAKEYLEQIEAEKELDQDLEDITYGE